MKADHEYMVEMIKPFVPLAERMDDKFVGYLFRMLIEHCDDVISGRLKLSVKIEASNVVDWQSFQKH